jgi:hypothetical protein
MDRHCLHHHRALVGVWINEQRVFKYGLRWLLRIPALDHQIAAKLEYVTNCASKPQGFFNFTYKN